MEQPEPATSPAMPVPGLASNPPYLSNRPSGPRRRRPQPAPPRETSGLRGRVVAERYLVQEQLEADCYRALHMHNGGLVALRAVEPGAGDVGHMLCASRRCAELRHNNIVPIIDYGWERMGTTDLHFLVEPLVRGPNLRSSMEWHGPGDTERALDVCRDLAKGLAAAHAIGMWHHDVRPATIILPSPGRPGPARLRGFCPDGARRSLDLTHPERARYVAPELLRGEPGEARSDVYAVGVVLYEMLSGRTPFDRYRTFELLLGKAQYEAGPLRDHRGVPVAEPVVRLVQRCLQADPEDRHESAEHLLDAVQQTRAACA